MNSLEKEAQLKVRGVSSDVTYKPSENLLNVPGFANNLKVKQLNMIAGGTGIAPCYQIIKSSLTNAKDKTKISLVYSNTTLDDILLKDELEKLQKTHSARFKLHFTLT